MARVQLDEACVVFFMPMPKSWSLLQQATMLGQPHRQKPDLDNLLKALFDALHVRDEAIASIRAVKVWADEGAILVKEGCAPAPKGEAK